LSKPARREISKMKKEQNTNRPHKLEVRVKALNERGKKERNLVISARNGYYLPSQ
jgi:hypothetical protein